MSKEKQSTAPADQDPRTDPINPLLAYALADQALPPLEDEIDLEDSEEGLTDEDRNVLDSLGSSDVVIRNVFSKLGSELELPLDPAYEPTTIGGLSTTDPVQESQLYPSEAIGRDHLIQRMEAIASQEYVSWPTSYRKKKELGRGGQGVVYLAECLDEFCGEHALKIFSPHPYLDAVSYQRDMERMAHVASLVHRLHIGNLIDVEHFVDQGGIHVMVMQLINGYDLKHLIDPVMVRRLENYADPKLWGEISDSVLKKPTESQHRLQPGFAVHIVEEILRALTVLHADGIVHGDIKPSNIMLACYGNVKLIDIGSAFELREPPQHRNWTPLYAPPEYLTDREWTEKSDLASLGYVLIELLSGRRSLMGPGGDQSTSEDQDERNEQLLRAKMKLPDILTEILPTRARQCTQLVNLCRKMIHPDPEQRFASASAAIEGEDGTFNFNKQLAQGNLVVHYALHIQRWLSELKHANEQRA